MSSQGYLFRIALIGKKSTFAYYLLLVSHINFFLFISSFLCSLRYFISLLFISFLKLDGSNNLNREVDRVANTLDNGTKERGWRGEGYVLALTGKTEVPRCNRDCCEVELSKKK